MRCGAVKAVHHRQGLVAARISLDAAGYLEAEPAVKFGGLKVVRLQHDLPASARLGLRLHGMHEAAAVSLLAHLRRDEEIADVAGCSSRPAVDAADYRSILVPQERGEKLAIRYAGGLHVERVETLVEKTNVLATRLCFQNHACGRITHDAANSTPGGHRTIQRQGP